jgi:hypothetical protein
MKLISVFLIIGYLIISCASDKVENTSSEPVQIDRLLIGTVATDSTPARFYEVDDPELVEEYFKLFVDTFKWNARPNDYDHRIQFFRGDEILENIYVNQTGKSYSFRGSEKIQSGIVRNAYWNNLAPKMKALEHETYIFPNSEMAEEFYQMAKSKKAFVSAPYFCQWRKYDGELFVRTNKTGDPITTDSMRAIISAQYPNDEFEIEPADLNFEFSTPREHERFKITCTYEFFRKFEFRNRRFEEVENPGFSQNGGDYSFRGQYIPFMLRIPLPPWPDITLDTETIVLDLTDNDTAEYFVKFAPVIGFVGNKSAKEALEKWLEKQ